MKLALMIVAVMFLSSCSWASGGNTTANCAGRFEVVASQTKVIMIDTQTGKTWSLDRLSYQGHDNEVWVGIQHAEDFMKETNDLTKKGVKFTQ